MKKVICAILVAAMAFTETRCGILFHPERSGNRGDRLDVFAVVLDCCWLFVGIIPGVVALVIDFSSGGAYYSMLPHPDQPEGETALCEGHGHTFALSGVEVGGRTEWHAASDR